MKAGQEYLETRWDDDGGGGLNQEAPTRAWKHVMFWLQLQALFLVNATFHHHAAAAMF